MAELGTQEEIILGILGYRDEEDDAWVALALEMDLRGYGSTFEEALDDLREHVIMQVSFALFKDQPEMIWKPADPAWFERFNEVRRQRLRAIYGQGEPVLENGGYRVRGMAIPPAHVIVSQKADYQLTRD